MKKYDVIVVGGSYAGMAATLALGRALRRVLLIDSGMPCNAATPFSHNLLTHDGRTPHEIASAASRNLKNYESVESIHGVVVHAGNTNYGFVVETGSGEKYLAKKLVFATGIADQIPDIPGFKECWGKSVLHCPYCHGYEVKQLPTGIFVDSNLVFDLIKLILHLADSLVVFTNGQDVLTEQQLTALARKNVRVETKPLAGLYHSAGYLSAVQLNDGSRLELNVIYAPRPFVQNSNIPNQLGCELSEEGYLKCDEKQRTSVPGIYACGDMCSKMRTLANAISTGTTAGMMVNKELAEEEFGDDSQK